MASIIKVDTIQDQDGNNIINEAANTITIGASGDTITIPSGATFASVGIDDNATGTAITIDSTKKVGIGTTSPTAKLEINAGDTFQQMKIRRGTGGTNAGIITFEQGDGTAVGHVGGVSGGGLQIRTGTGTGTEYMRIDSSGNVGIGTSTPTARFDTRISTLTGKVAEFHNSGGYGIDLTVESNSGVNTISSGNTQGLAFATNGSSNERMRIDSSGNVGINTTSINFAGFGSSTSGLNITATGNNSAIRLVGNTAGDFYTITGSGAHWLYGKGAVPMTFSTDSTERMRIDSSGNVGIGETAPVSKLHIKNSGQTIENTSGIGAEAINFVYARGGGSTGITVTLATLGTPTTGSYAHARIDWSSIYDTTSDNGGVVSEILWLKRKSDGTYSTKKTTLGSVGNFISGNFYWDNNVLKVDIPVYTDISANITITQHSFSSITLNV